MRPRGNKVESVTVQMKRMLLNIVVDQENLVDLVQFEVFDVRLVRISQATDSRAGKTQRQIFAEVESLQKGLIGRSDKRFIVHLPLFQRIVFAVVLNDGEIESNPFHCGGTRLSRPVQRLQMFVFEKNIIGKVGRWSSLRRCRTRRIRIDEERADRMIRIDTGDELGRKGDEHQVFVQRILIAPNNDVQALSDRNGDVRHFVRFDRDAVSSDDEKRMLIDPESQRCTTGSVDQPEPSVLTIVTDIFILGMRRWITTAEIGLSQWNTLQCFVALVGLLLLCAIRCTTVEVTTTVDQQSRRWPRVSRLVEVR